MSDPLKVELVTVDNILGVKHVELRPGQVTVIKGPSDVGKTSILEAIKAAVGGGKDATLLRHGEAEGQVCLVLEDGMQVTRRVTERGADLTVKHPEYGRMGAGQSILDGLLNEASFNPVAFVESSSKKRVDMLLGILPKEVKAEVVTALGGKPDDGVLDLIAKAYKAVYDERTGVNRSLKDKQGTVTTLRATLPPVKDMDTDWAAEVSRAEAEIRAKQAARAARVQEKQDQIEAGVSIDIENLERQRKSVLDNAEVAVEAETVSYGRVLNDLDAQIEEATKVLTGLQKTRATREAEHKAKCSEIRLRANGSHDEIGKEIARVRAGLKEAKTRAETDVDTETTTVIAELQKALAVARTKADAVAKANVTRQFVKDTVAEVEALSTQSEALSARLEQIQSLKTKLLDRIAIPGLSVVDGEVLVDDVPFDRLSDSRKIEVAVRIAAACPGPLGLVCVDGLEKFDTVRFEKFCEEVRKTSIQVIGTRVDDGAFRVETESGIQMLEPAK